MNEPKLAIQIKELKLSGVAPGKRERARQALERELTRLVAEEGTPRSVAWGQSVAPRSRTRIRVKPGMKADDVGARVAREVYRGLEKGS